RNPDSVKSNMLDTITLPSLTSIRMYVDGRVEFFFSSRRRHTRFSRDWSSDVCSSDLERTVRSLGITNLDKEQRHCPSTRTVRSRSEERRVGKERKSGTQTAWRRKSLPA